jgi:hypothetical protein
MAIFSGGHWIEKGKGEGASPGKFVKDYSPGSSNHLAIAKLDELVLALNSFISQFNAFLAHVDTGNVAGIGNTNAATYSGVKVSQTASDEMIQSPKSTNL